MRRIKLIFPAANLTRKYLVLPCLFTKVLSQLGQGEAGQLPHVFYSQGFCNGATQLTPEITSA